MDHAHAEAQRAFDPYAVLGVAIDANVAEIRAAFRAKTKTEHPDAPGGTKDKFEAIKLAESLLLDPARRAHYDKTGEVVDKPTEVNPDEPALALIARLLGAMFAEGLDPNDNDFVAVMASAAQAEIDKTRKRINDLGLNVATVCEIGRRFSRIDGEPDERIPGVVEWHVRQIELMRTRGEQGIKDCERAIAILREYKFATFQRVQFVFAN